MTTPEGAKGWVDPAGSAQSGQAATASMVAPDASPDGIRAEARTREQDGGGEPSNAPNAARQMWYFTFGWGQPWAGRFFVVKDATCDEAREKMFRAFGREWGFQYDESQWISDGVSQADEYGLTEIK